MEDKAWGRGRGRKGGTWRGEGEGVRGLVKTMKTVDDLYRKEGVSGVGMAGGRLPSGK